MTSDSHHSLAITDDEYFIALVRVNSGQHTDDDLRLIREWTARQEQERAELLSKLRSRFEAVTGGFSRSAADGTVRNSPIGGKGEMIDDG